MSYDAKITVLKRLMLRINIISTCEIGYKNTLARMVHLYFTHNGKPQKQILSGGNEHSYKEDRKITLQRNGC